MSPSADRSESPEPLVTFYRAIPGGRDPIRADRSALGTLPAAAFQYCEAVTSASAWGWYVFLPRTVWLRWDGTDAEWTHEGVDQWLSVKADLHPGFEDWFDAHAPEGVKGYCPPWVSRTLAPGVVQLWTGLFMRTRDGWSSLVRPMANVARSKQYEIYEGIVETDRWFGPLFVNVRLSVTDTPVELTDTRPLFQVQPLLRETYAERHLRSIEVVRDLSGLSADDWDRYHRTVVATSSDPTRQPGGYATAVRKRQAAEG